MAALEELFDAARGIMGWLGYCAKVCLCFIHAIAIRFFFFRLKKSSYFLYGILIMKFCRLLLPKTSLCGGQLLLVFLLCSLTSNQKCYRLLSIWALVTACICYCLVIGCQRKQEHDRVPNLLAAMSQVLLLMDFHLLKSLHGEKFLLLKLLGESCLKP